jgi:hypothetical protein
VDSKKAGSNCQAYLASSNERSASFMVSPSKEYLNVLVAEKAVG